VVRDSQDSGCQFFATHLSVFSFTRTAHSFACSAPLTFLLTRSTVLIHVFATSLTLSQARIKVYYLMSQNQTVLNHSGVKKGERGGKVMNFD